MDTLEKSLILLADNKVWANWYDDQRDEIDLTKKHYWTNSFRTKSATREQVQESHTN